MPDQSRSRVHELVDQLPDSELYAASRYLEFLRTGDGEEVDEETTEKVLASESDPRPTIPFDEVKRRYGL